MMSILIIKTASLRRGQNDPVSKGADVFHTLRDAPSGLLRDTENVYVCSPIVESGRKQGFTLIEVTIALAILAASLVTLLAGINAGVLFSDRDRDYTIASFLAQEKMTELERNPNDIAAGYEKDGEFEDEFERFAWEAKIDRDENTEAWADMVGVNFEALKATVTITWKRGSVEQKYVLEEVFLPTVITKTTTQ